MTLSGDLPSNVTKFIVLNGTTEATPSWNSNTTFDNFSNPNDVINDKASGDISDESTKNINFAFECVTIPILVTFGVTGNILSLIVLSQRRLRRSSTNVLLIGLAMSDLLYLLSTVVRKSTCIISRFDPILSYKYFVLSFSGAYYVNTCFSRVSSLLVAVISIERLLAVTLPMKVRLLCRRTTVVITVIAVLVFTFASLVLLPLQYAVKYVNKTPYLRYNDFYLENKEFVEIYNRYLTVAVLRWLPKVIVVVCNGIIIAFLWRRTIPVEAAENVISMANVSRTQRKITLMLVTVAVVFVLTLLPGDAFWLASMLVDGFRLYGKYNNLFDVLSDVTLTFEIINSSINFVIYMVLNSTFSEVYLILFCPCLSKTKRLLHAGSATRCFRVQQSRQEVEGSMSCISQSASGCDSYTGTVGTYGSIEVI